jgi:hypothetical protein
MKVDRLELALSVLGSLILANLGLHFELFTFKDAILSPIGGAAGYLFALLLAAECNEE